MKTLNRTIIAFVALSLLAAGFASANNAPAATVTPSAPSPAPAPTPPAPPTPPTLPALAPISTVNNDIYGLTRGFSFGSRSAGADTVLVIPSGQTKTEDLLTINEDMSVMSRIFQKNLEQNRIPMTYGSFFASRRNTISMLTGGRSLIQSMYLQGYGALFLMKVDFPLSPSSDAQQEQEQTEKGQEGDPVWQEMRQEMYEPQKVDRRRRTGQPEEKYDAEKVENLKTTLIKALKHAVNIRSLKPDESVILTVIGSGESTGTIITTSRIYDDNQVIVQEKDADGTMKTRIIQGNSLDDIGLSSPTILVIRAKRSEIDDFAKGELDFDKFRGRVQILTYPLLSGAVGSLSSHSDNIGLY